MNQLVDRWGRAHTYLRLSVTDRCNLQCNYCVAAQGIYTHVHREELLSFEEIERLTRLLANHGVHKVRLTGGEPLLRKGLPELVARLRTIETLNTIAMTTNGVLLKNHIGELRRAGLTQLTISLDTLRPQRFARITGASVRLFFSVLEAVELAIAEGFQPLKLNVVVLRGFNEDELEDFVELTHRLPLNVRFIEFMPLQGNSWDRQCFIAAREMLERLAARYELRFLADATQVGGTTRDFQVPGYRGWISFIAPISAPFCYSCSRLRVTATGLLKVCLFAPPLVDLRRLLRTGATEEDIIGAIHNALQRKAVEHPPAEELSSVPTLPMTVIGG
jgi:molybdenum cofactor biosynthesis protein A